jgi:thiamine-phosphate pyrophosphorylase
VILHALVDDLAVARAAIDGGATHVQLRLKNLSTTELVELGLPFRDLCVNASVTFIVNDDVEAALRLGADGVHLGSEDEGIERARAAGLVLGLSAQDVGEAMVADHEHPDYLGVGPVWATPIKAGVPPLGVDGLREICESVATPVVAIGGIDATKAVLCMEAGAVGVAVVRASVDASAVRTALERAAV